MSGSSKEALKPRLLQLKCQFTWNLLLKNTDPDELEDRLHYQLEFLDTKNKYMVHNFLAYAMHLKKDYTEAILNLEMAEEMIKDMNKENNPDGADQKYLVTYGNYAWVYYYMKQYEDSQKYVDKVEQIYKELQDRQDIAEIYGEKGWSLLKFCGKYYEEAKQCFQKALELEPENPEWITGYATVVYRLEGFNNRTCAASECKSLELLKSAVEKNPNDAVVKALLALKLQDLNRTGEGRRYIEGALEQAPNSPYLLRYVAKFYRRAGMVDEALRVLKTAVDLIPTSGFLHHQIGLCYRKKYFICKKGFGTRNPYNRQKQPAELNGLIQNAIFHFEKTVEYKKTYVFANVDLANMYSEAKEYQKADERFKTVLAFTNLTDEEKQQIYDNYGRFKEYCMGSESEAIDYYKKSLQITVLSQERESSEKSLRRISSKKIRNNIRDAKGYALLGFVYKTKGERNDAIDSYEKALEYDPYNEEYVTELCELKLMI
ncbi:interferon-induced protein with tetratricopeptide repeats 5-like isoform X1 [Dendrobates tinctorius]|uniref:interferon-induced protein with tetratricopeptide repeats 5-like isoform X1 n=2 Tax=Dendrobates tinctorius TaxID=92724 RepID=UPI003CC9AC06